MGVLVNSVGRVCALCAAAQGSTLTRGPLLHVLSSPSCHFLALSEKKKLKMPQKVSLKKEKD